MARRFQRYRSGRQTNLLTDNPDKPPTDEFETALLEMELDFADPAELRERESSSEPSTTPNPLSPSWLLPAEGEAGKIPTLNSASLRNESCSPLQEVNSFRDVLSLFGPTLSILAGVQIYSAWMLSRIAASSGFKGLDLNGLALAAAIALSLFALDAVFLRIHFGKHHLMIAPWVSGLTFGSGIFGLSCHLALRFF